MTGPGQPAWLWEPQAGAMLWANQAAISLWGAGSLRQLQDLRHDRAMPAIPSLRSLAVVLAPDATDVQTLVFWLPEGSRSFVCLCRKVAFPGMHCAVLVEVLTLAPDPSDSSVASPGSGLNGHAGPLDADVLPLHEPARQQPPQLAPEDAATLAEIARLVRMRRDGAALSAATELPLEANPSTAAAPAIRPSDVEFLAKLSHEMRTPLNAIIGFAELLRAEQLGPIGNGKYLEYAGNILESAHHCLGLTNDLFDLAGLSGGKQALDFSEVDVNESIRVCLGIAGPIAGKAGVSLTGDLVPDLPRAILDRRSLRQILLNLIANAIKFTPASGRVTVSTHYDVGAGLRMVVTDTGRGMSAGGLERARGIMPGEASGSGLGLPICRALAEANGGRLDVDSQPGAGTRVTLSLPMSRLVLL